MVIKCFICQIESVNKKEFIKHISSDEHKNAVLVKKIYKNDTTCGKCLKSFTTKGNTERHELICKGLINSNECDFCHKIFETPVSKGKHKLICKGIMLKTINKHNIYKPL
jgi:uncharacterized Zn-finger protein